MDGVIADFDKKYIELHGMTPREAEKHKKFDSLFNEFIEQKGKKNCHYHG
jgi:hypothetical protein